MIRILHLETATTVCSVALSENGKLIDAIDLEDEGYAHGEQLTLLIDKLLTQNKLTFDQLDAIGVSAGPGSYTGLRIGVSTAKGLCYALKIPLLAINTLESMCEIARQHFPTATLCPMIDARRMEVFSLIEDASGNQIKIPSADVLDADSYSDFEPLVCFGDGASKMKAHWSHRNVVFYDENTVTARGQVELAYAKFQRNEVQDVAYFEPNYIKAFYQAPSTKKQV